jgi:hypothetical protein
VRFFLMEARTGTPVQRSAFSSRWKSWYIAE